MRSRKTKTVDLSKIPKKTSKYKADYLAREDEKPLLPTTGHLKFSIRLKKLVTSLTIKKNIIVLWVLLTTDLLQEDTKYNEQLASDIKNLVHEFIDDCLTDWDKSTGRGLSDFVSDKMVLTFLDKDSGLDEYPQVMKIL